MAEVYEDPGVSGALFLGREHFQRMLRDAKAGVFDVLVVFDLDRFGRDAHKSMVALNELADLGISVVDYASGRMIDVDSAEGQMMTTMKTVVAQQFRDQIRKHTKNAMWDKAQRGFVCGGRVFGYDNVRMSTGHSEYRVNEAEAAVVREIYRRFADGEGARTIAKALNAAKVRKPRAQQGRADGWSDTTIRAVLERPLYRGEVVYGRAPRLWGRELKKVRPGTTREKGQVDAPEETWVRVERPELAIVPPALALRVDQLRADRAARYAASLQAANGRMPEKSHGKCLLSGGMLVCGKCGAHYEARLAPWKGQRNVYLCSSRRRKPGVCDNTLAIPMDDADATLISVEEDDVLRPDLVDRALDRLDLAGDDVAALEREAERLRLELKRLADSLAAGVPAETIAPAMRERQSALRRVEARLRAPRIVPKRTEVRAALEKKVADWKTRLRAEPEVARVVLRELVGPVTLYDPPVPEAVVRWWAEVKAHETLASVAGFSPSVWLASPTGLVMKDVVTGQFRRAA